jgi:hypothetical protein
MMNLNLYHHLLLVILMVIEIVIAKVRMSIREDHLILSQRLAFHQ